MKYTSTKYPLVGKETHKEDTIVKIGDIPFGNGFFNVIAGPCAIESYKQMLNTSKSVKTASAIAIRGGAYKPRTSPYSFQGLGLNGLKILKLVSQKLNIPSITEIIDTTNIKLTEQYCDAFQIGARNMQNFQLLKAVGETRKPIILKRSMCGNIEELLFAAEYIASKGNSNIILCERGIRTFNTYTRYTLDLNAIPYLRSKTHLPIIVDPSHGTGIRQMVSPMSKAAMACGADGLIIEVHHNPNKALSDGNQSLYPKQFKKLMIELKKLSSVLNKKWNTNMTC